MLTYDKELPWQNYARLTVITNDLDPVYVALAKSGWEEEKIMRWCAAFIAFYHTGTACEAADLQGDEFWNFLWDRYDNNPRGSERRHFRGEAGKKALKAWRDTYSTPEKFLLACMKPSFMQTLKAGIPQIGTYFTWKVCDFREAVFGYDMDWSGAEHNMLATATNGLELLFPKEPYHESVFKLLEAIDDLYAPPRFDRKCGLAEAETVACGVRQYYTRGVPIGEDIVAKRTSLGNSDNAKHLSTKFPKEPTEQNLDAILSAAPHLQVEAA